MKRYLYRQRRRLILAFALMVLAVDVFLVGHESQLQFDRAPVWAFPVTVVVTSLIMGLAYMPVALALVLAKPLRGWADMVPMVVLGIALAHAAGLGELPPPWPAIAPVLIGMAMPFIAYGPQLNHLLPKGRVEARATFHSPLPPPEVWDRLSPTGKGPHWESRLQSAERQGEAGLKMTYDIGGAEQSHLGELLEHRPPHRKCSTMAVTPAKGIGAEVRTHSQLTITPAPQGGSQISLHEAQTGLLARNALGMWLDDLLGDMLDTQEHSACGKTTPCRSLTTWMARKDTARDNNAKA